ncbi:hypothetical protein NQ315_012402 [Exocentrus adspersus]|uniref:HAT C-terminal dimerisation domain-containing protein n=1 Tax=Exocentrus adspersus TaxID=1586481 RepID=A0AAV8VNX3_9CUCU|nr:hypothetical protein NQ315_012402 [Exocentrus adspersus]
MYSDDCNYAYLCFLKPILKDVNRVNKCFESNNADPIEKTLRHQKFDITLILEQFNKKPDEIAQIDNQWRKIHLIDWVNTSDTNKFWVEVLNYKDSQGVVVFEELALFALALLTLPHSNAEVERLFSQMNLSAGFATKPAAQSPAKARVYPGHSKAKEPVADQPLQRADVPSTRPGTDSEPVRKQVHVGVNPVVLLGFTVAVLSRQVHSDDPPY